MSGAVAPRTIGRDDVMSPLEAWAQSGLMWLTGEPDGSPAIVDFDAMARIDALLAGLHEASTALGGLPISDVRLLTERASLAGLSRGGQSSCNRSCRLIETRDGWIAVNLPRARDIEALPAWTGTTAENDPWTAVARACGSATSAELCARAELLGLAVSEAPLTRATTDGDFRLPTQTIGAGVERSWQRRVPLVIDLSALWAGPLCGHLLAQAGARVIKVESVTRPDSIRSSSPEFFDTLNAGKESVLLDFTRGADRAHLVSMIARADVVITSARPRAFAQMGLEPEYLGSLNPGLTWVAVTAHGWAGERGNRIGFGDDVAAAVGLLGFERGRPMFLGDAIADPLTGIAAATAAFDALSRGGGVLIDASLREAAGFVASAPGIDVAGPVVHEHGGWFIHLDGIKVAVAPPSARPGTGRAVPAGADTQRVLEEFA